MGTTTNETTQTHALPLDRQPEDSGQRSKCGRTRWSRRRKVLVAISGVVGSVLLLVSIVVGYFVVQEMRSPSGRVFVETNNGRVELELDDTAAAPVVPAQVDLSNWQPQPPTMIQIPSAGVQSDIYMMTDAVPDFPAAGWQFGSAMPGTDGNVVLYGAREGPNAVFERLPNLNVGDEIVIRAGEIDFVYQVTQVAEVPSDQTDLLLPQEHAVVTLLTDAGEWDESAQGYSHRLVVQGSYLTAREWSGSP